MRIIAEKGSGRCAVTHQFVVGKVTPILLQAVASFLQKGTWYITFLCLRWFRMFKIAPVTFKTSTTAYKKWAGGKGF
jgi:hypothetical protein